MVSRQLVAIFSEGEGFASKADPCPVVKVTSWQPEAICPMALTGS